MNFLRFHFFSLLQVEMHFLPKFELMVVMPTYVVVKHKDTMAHTMSSSGLKNNNENGKIAYTADFDQFVEASVEGTFVLERLAKGNVTVRWFVKKVDYQTPMYNDTVSYREVRSLNITYVFRMILHIYSYMSLGRPLSNIYQYLLSAIQLQKKSCQHL